MEQPKYPPREIIHVDDYIPITVIGDDYRMDDQQAETLAKIAARAGELGFTIRFQAGSKSGKLIEQHVNRREAYTPFKKADFNYDVYTTHPAVCIAKRYSPSFDTQRETVRPVMGMFANLVLGRDLKSPTRIVVLWTPDGVEASAKRTAKTGFIGVAIGIASAFRIPVFNIANPASVDKLKELLAEYGEYSGKGLVISEDGGYQKPPYNPSAGQQRQPAPPAQRDQWREFTPPNPTEIEPSAFDSMF